MNKTDFLAAAGCEILPEGDAFVRNKTYFAAPEWPHIVGDWRLNSESVYTTGELGSIKANAFSQHVDQKVDCTGAFCRYQRALLPRVVRGQSCSEEYATNIGPAAFRDRSNKLGAAVFTGGPLEESGGRCKSKFSEFDTPADHTLSVINMMASVGEIEAMHFDPIVSAGLIITDNIDEVVNGVPAGSQLPLDEMTADIVFHLGVEDFEEHPLFSAMQRIVCSDATRPVNCGCDKGIRITWRWQDAVMGRITFSMAVALERPSADPNNYGEGFLEYTKTNVGPGVGYVQYFEWTSPDRFAFKGDWVDMGVTYDGKYARFYTNGSLVHERHMCRSSCPEDDPECECGNIVYPASYHRCPQFCVCPTEECRRLRCPCGSNGPGGFAACQQGDDAKPGDKTFVGIGTYLEKQPQRIDTQIGMIHHVRLFKKDLGPSYFKSKRAEYAKIKAFKVSSDESHQVNSNSQGNPDAPLCQPDLPPPSPNVTYVDIGLAKPDATFKVHGFFRCLDDKTGQFNPRKIDFRARFSYTYPSGRTVFLDTPKCEGTDPDLNKGTCRGPGAASKYTDHIICTLPSNRAWKHGYKATVLQIIETKWYEDLPEDSYVMSRACYMPACGWLEKKVRVQGEERIEADDERSLPRKGWPVLSGCCGTGQVLADGTFRYQCDKAKYLLSTAMSGALSYVRFITHSKMMTLTAGGNLTTRVLSAFGDSATDRLNWTQFGSFDSKQAPFSDLSSLTMLGASSVRSFTVDNEAFLAVANYWDGRESRVLSPIFRVDGDVKSGTMHLTMMQGIPTFGARDIQLLRLGGSAFVLVANFESESVLYRWRGKESISSIDVLDKGQGYIDADVRLVCVKGPRGDACRTLSLLDPDLFHAKLTVDGPPGEEFRGSIASVEVTQTFQSMTDVDVAIFYPGTDTPMERTVTSIWSKPSTYVSCARAIDSLEQRRVTSISRKPSTYVACVRAIDGLEKLRLVPNSTEGCKNGSILTADLYRGFQATVMNITATGVNEYNQSIGEISELLLTRTGFASEPTLRSNDEGCTCKLGHWSKCLLFTDIVNKVQIRGKDGAFAAEADVEHGVVGNIDILDRGADYNLEPELDVQSDNSFFSNCSCLDSSLSRRSGWGHCFEVSVQTTRAKLRLVPGSTEGCKNGSILTADLYRGFQATVMNITATGVNEYNQSIGEISELLLTRTGFASEPTLRSNDEGCTCKLGHWSKCLLFTDIVNKVQIRGKDGAFAAEADVEHGVVGNIDILDRGADYNLEPELDVQSDNSFFSNCSCLDSSLSRRSGWGHCFRVSVPQGSHRCMGGEKDGEACAGDGDLRTCVGTKEVFDLSGDKVLDSGECRPPPMHPVSGRSGARLSLRPVLDAPERVRKRHLREQPWWAEAPWISSQTPIDISENGKISLGFAAGIWGGVSAVATFEKGSVLYCVFAVYLDPEARDVTTVDSKLVKLGYDAATGDIDIRLIQELPTNGASGVSIFSMPLCRPVCKSEFGRQNCKKECMDDQTFVFFPCQVGDISPLYVWNDLTSRLDLVQAVPTTRAVSAASFQFPEPYGDWYVAIGQMEMPASVRRWNGTDLLSRTHVDTLPQDTAGGSELETMLSGGVFKIVSSIWETPNQVGKTPLILAASYGSRASQLFKTRVETVLGMATPVRLVVHRAMKLGSVTNESAGIPVDRIYVASYGNSGIVCFERQPALSTTDYVSTTIASEIFYRHNLLVTSTTIAADTSMQGLSLHGINDMAVQGDILYTASSLAHGGGCIHVFNILPTGELVEQAPLRMLASEDYGLRGVRALSVGPTRVFAASVVDQAVSLFSRDPSSGAMSYRSHVFNGEKLIGRFMSRVPEYPPVPLIYPPIPPEVIAAFERELNTSNSSNVSVLPTPPPLPLVDMIGVPVRWHEGRFPIKFGHGMPWRDRARSVTHCIIHDMHLFLIILKPEKAADEEGNEGGGEGEDAEKDSEPDDPGKVVIYRWIDNTVVKHSELAAETQAFHVEHFSEVNAAGVEWHYLVVANGEGLSSLYRYNVDYDSFFLFNKIPITLPDGTALPPYCADGEASCDSTQFFKLPNIEQRLPPWGRSRPTSEARKAHVFRIEGFPYLAIAAWWPRSSNGYTWFSYIYKWQTRGTTVVADNTTATGIGFELFQVVPTSGAFDVLSAQVEFFGCFSTTLLYFANRGFGVGDARILILKYSRTVGNALTGNPGAFYEIQSIPSYRVSSIEVFSSGDEHFLVIGKQFLDGAEWGVYKWTEGEPEGSFEMHQDLSGFQTGQEHITRLVAATALKFFQWDGQGFLAVGQSFCSPELASDCRCIAADESFCTDREAPVTGLLHWDADQRKFSDMRPLYTSYHHEQALRVRAGAVKQMIFAPVPGNFLLLLASFDEGISVFEWDFERIVGMQEVQGIAADPSETAVYSVYDGAPVAMRV